MVQQLEREAKPAMARPQPRGTDFTVVAHAMLAPGVRYAELSSTLRQDVMLLGYELARRFAHPAHQRMPEPKGEDARRVALVAFLDAAVDADAVPFEAGWPENKDNDPPLGGGGGGT